jgi:serine-type D-Ala-D-Ala carboxypeptidase (penicillin-binding protein 5/6)
VRGGLSRALGVVAAVALLGGATAAPSGAAAQAAPTPEARAWVLVDAADRERLAGHAISEQHAIASATKLMTAYVALRELPLRRELKAPAYQASSPLETLAGLQPGERMSVSDLLHALLLASANDAAVTLAEGASGSVARFVREMNTAAAALGLTRTRYENPIGLDSATNYSSAGDLAALTLRLRREPSFRRIVDTEHALLKTGDRTREVDNRNALLLKYPWVTGVKTGHTLEAGDVLVASATQKGATLVSVVLGAPSEAARDAGTLELLEYGFSLYRQRTVARDGERLASPELEDQSESLPLVAKDGLQVGLRRGQRLRTSTTAPSEVEGPVKRGERLGKLTATVDGRGAGTVPLVAARAADEATFLERARGQVPPAILVAIGAVVILIGVAAARRSAWPWHRNTEERMRSQEERLQRGEREEVGQGQGGPR